MADNYFFSILFFFRKSFLRKLRFLKYIYKGGGDGEGRKLRSKRLPVALLTFLFFSPNFSPPKYIYIFFFFLKKHFYFLWKQRRTFFYLLHPLLLVTVPFNFHKNYGGLNKYFVNFRFPTKKRLEEPNHLKT